MGELVSKIVKHLQKNNYTACILLDLSKAFDTLQHSVMFDKLEKYGIQGTCLKWFKSYLMNREMQVKCNISGENKPTISNKHVVNYGTPQGSCLGPLIFLVFCNNLNLHLSFLNCIQFADDTTLYFSSRDLNYVQNYCNLDMIMLQDWFQQTN